MTEPDDMTSLNYSLDKKMNVILNSRAGFLTSPTKNVGLKNVLICNHGRTNGLTAKSQAISSEALKKRLRERTLVHPCDGGHGGGGGLAGASALWAGLAVGSGIPAAQRPGRPAGPRGRQGPAVGARRARGHPAPPPAGR